MTFIAHIEDNDDDAELVRRELDANPAWDYDIEHVTDLGSFEELAADKDIDAILLDLMLPDSSGEATVRRARAVAADVPILALTGSASLGLEAINAGADDFLDKDVLGEGRLDRAIRFAIARASVRSESDRLLQQRELNAIRTNAATALTPVSAASVGSLPLDEVAPEFFNEAVRVFISVVSDRLTDSLIGNHGVGDDRIRQLGTRLAEHFAGPDDIVSILTQALQRQRQGLGTAHFGPFVREARLALIELLGLVLIAYRRYSPRRESGIDIRPRLKAATPDDAPAGVVRDI